MQQLAVAMQQRHPLLLQCNFSLLQAISRCCIFRFRNMQKTTSDFKFFSASGCGVRSDNCNNMLLHLSRCNNMLLHAISWCCMQLPAPNPRPRGTPTLLPTKLSTDRRVVFVVIQANFFRFQWNEYNNGPPCT